MMGKRELYKTFYTAWGKAFPYKKRDDMQKECNAAWNQLKKNIPTGEGLTEATNKRNEELRREKNETKNYFFNV